MPLREKMDLQRRLHAEARRRGWVIWIVPATTVGEHYEVHLNWQSYWTTVGLKPRSAEQGGNLAWAIERAAEYVIDLRERRARRAVHA